MEFRGDPTARRRRDADESLETVQEVVRRHLQGESIRSIAKNVGLPKTSVHRTVMDYRRSKRESDRDVEQAAVFARLSPGLSVEDVTEASQIPLLNALEPYRMEHLPLGHPARRALTEAYAAGWRWPWPAEMDSAGRDCDW
jgi:hypothetical protein